MPTQRTTKTAKKETKSTARTAKKKSPPKIEENIIPVVNPPFEMKKRSFNFIIPVVLAVLIIGLLGYLLKDQFLVATINGRPVFRYELNQRLTRSYGKEILENMIIEKLISNEARKNNLIVSEADIDQEIAKISEGIGEGTNIEELLLAQGMTMKDFRDQIKIRLEVNRLLSKDVSVTDEEIDRFIEENSQMLTATDEAEKREEAKDLLTDQKIGEKLQPWLTELKNNASIQRFLK